MNPLHSFLALTQRDVRLAKLWCPRNGSAPNEASTSVPGSRSSASTRKRLHVRDASSGKESEQAYDKLVIATGASALKPPLPGIDLAGVFLLRELSDGAAIKQHLERTEARTAVIVGGGYIGMEMAEALRMRSLSVTVVEKLDRVVPEFGRSRR